MTTTTTTAAMLRDLIAAQSGKLYVGFRYSADDAAAFVTDQECIGADFLTVENKGGRGESAWLVVGTAPPTRTMADHDRIISPNVAAAFVSSMLKCPRPACTSERWAAVLTRAGSA